LWSSVNQSDDDNGEPFDLDYSIEDIDQDSLHKMRKDCDAFIEKCGALLDDIDDAQAGHDFWLTRNRHGAGFWDRGLGDLGDKLTDIAHSFGEKDLYIGDDDKIHIE
jgi:hypothetical protein